MDKEELKYERTAATKDKEFIKKALEYSKGYKEFLDNGKTEREVCKETIKMAEEAGYKEYIFGDQIIPGSKLYYNNRGKSLFLIKAGTKELIKEGVKILVAHVDSPRLDLKQVPLYQSDDIAYLKTHYYGGIKKYQWLTIPLALHGVVAKKDGSRIDIRIGEDENDPVFCISDLLPHLSQEIVTKTVATAFPGENLNVIVGSIPMEEEEKDAVKLAVLDYLNKEYGITEEDFLSAEIEVVPAFKARDVGFDRSFIASYGHDDRVCAYPEITATLETETDRTVVTILADKEEIGSEGNSGMQCIVIKDILDAIAESYGISSALLRSKSQCLSADVTAAYDPNYKSAFESMNTSYVGYGVAMSKFTGSRGKSGSNDASAEYIGYLRRIFEENGVIWQTGELGRVDLGGGGTVAKFLASYNIDTVDLGVPVLSMHAPYELVSKVDVYSAHLAFVAFIK